MNVRAYVGISLSPRMKKTIVSAIRGALIIAATVLLAEGLASIILLISGLRSPAPALAERRHTRYDAEIGWVAIPNLRIPDMYGPGLSLRTDENGARAKCEVAFFRPLAERAYIRRRIFCSGDSFTLGFGVGDGQAWPALLSRGGRDTVNLGQGGYDLGQSYLWFRRWGEGRTYDVHLLALTPPLLERMRSAAFLGYGKPLLRSRSGSLAIDNQPVPRRPFYLPWLGENRGAFEGLRLATLIGKLRRSDPPGSESLLSEEEAERAASLVFRDLSERARKQGGRLVVAYLPLREAYDLPSPERWHRFVREEARRQGLVFWDLVEEMKKLPRERIAELFIADGAVAHPYAAGHYSAAGNAWVAEVIGGKLTDLGY